MNYLKMGAETLQAKMELYGGVDVVYRRPGQFSFSIRAIPGRNPVEITDQSGMVLRGQVQDFVIDIKSLKTAIQTDSIKRPLRGDEIVMELAGERIVFVVNGEDFATSHYEPADPYGVAWRIHTKSDRRI